MMTSIQVGMAIIVLSMLTLHPMEQNEALRHSLKKAVFSNNKKLVKELLNQGVNPNETLPFNGPPAFFHADLEMVHIFMEHGLDVHATDRDNINVLEFIVQCWRIMDPHCTPELIKLYLNQNVNPRKIYAPFDSCLLHELARNLSIDNETLDNLGEKVQLLINAIPDMINLPDGNGNTPLDVALLQQQEWPKAWDIHERLINVFKANRALTARELTSS
jgi:hypothetical protein